MSDHCTHDPDASLLQNTIALDASSGRSFSNGKTGRSRGAGNVCSNSQCLLSSFQECDRLPSSAIWLLQFILQSVSIKGANYGGIGAVIAHEISMRLIDNGAKFDESGNLNNW